MQPAREQWKESTQDKDGQLKSEIEHLRNEVTALKGKLETEEKAF